MAFFEHSRFDALQPVPAVRLYTGTALPVVCADTAPSDHMGFHKMLVEMAERGLHLNRWKTYVLDDGTFLFKGTRERPYDSSYPTWTCL